MKKFITSSKKQKNQDYGVTSRQEISDSIIFGESDNNPMLGVMLGNLSS